MIGPAQRWRHGRTRFRPPGETIDPSRYGVELLVDDTTPRGFVERHLLAWRPPRGGPAVPAHGGGMISMPDRIARQLGILDPRDTRPRKCRPRVVLTPTLVVLLRGRRVVAVQPLPTELLGLALGALAGWGWA